MEIYAMSKMRFDNKLKELGITEDNVEQHEDKCFICISHSSVSSKLHGYDDDADLMPAFSKNMKNVIRLFFDDIRFSIFGYTMFTHEQAAEIIEFLEKMKGASELYIHCAMGQSRSVAVGEFAAEMFGQRPEFINARIDRSPNTHVLKTLRDEYNRRNSDKYKNAD